MSHPVLDALHKQRESVEKNIKRGEALERLLNNPDFKDVILTFFCLEESAEYVHASANPMLSPEQQQSALNFARAGGALKEWLTMHQTMADQFKDKLLTIEEEIADFNSGDASNVDEDQDLI